MRNASGHQCKVKMSRSEKKVNENTYNISSIKRVTKRFLEVSRFSRAKQRQRNVQEKCTAHAKLLFANQTYCCFSPFSGVACLRCLALHVLYFVSTNHKYYRERHFQPWLNLVQSQYGVFPVPVGQFVLVTYPRRTIGKRLDKSRMRMPRCFLKFKDGVNVVSSRRFCLITIVDICRIDFCLPTLNSHQNVIHSSMKIGTAPSISSFQLSYRSLPLANFKVKTILTRVL